MIHTEKEQALSAAYRVLLVLDSTDPAWTVAELLDVLDTNGLTEDRRKDAARVLDEMHSEYYFKRVGYGVR